MKKKIILGALIGLCLITGCSKQPSLKEAKELQTTSEVIVNENNKTQATIIEEESIVVNEDDNIVEEEVVNIEDENIVEEDVIVNTEKIEEIEKESISVSATTNNQDFAKKLSSIVIYFDFDKYNIRPDQWPKVEELAELIKSNPSNYTVRIEGNCDEWGTEEYNYALGLRRANSVRKALIKLGVDPKKLTVISYGELNPVCTVHAKWCWRKNRRDNFTYLP